MSELKTLKDFEFENKKDLAYDCAYYTISTKLRAEAIKWIKRYCDDYQVNFSDLKETFSPTEKQPFAFIFNAVQDLESKRDGLGIIAFIKHFFNITEEDLQNE